MAGRGERWDRERFDYERERDVDRGRGFEDDRFSMRSGGRGRDRSDDRFDRRPTRGYEEDPYAARDRRFHDDDYAGYRPEPRRQAAPPEAEYDRRRVMEMEREREPPRSRRPDFLRRQSSLDTYDRRPLRQFYEREEYPAPARREDIYRDNYRAPPNTDIPLPRTKALPDPRRSDDRFYHEDEIRVADPDYYGDDHFRPPPERVEEREVVRTRKRRDSHGTQSTRTRTRRGSVSSSSSSSSSAGGTSIARSEYPKKGKTRVPARLASKRAIIDLGYPFVEEGNTIIIQKALGQKNIDELLKLSEEYKKSEQEIAKARSSAGDIDERREEFFVPPAATPAQPPPPSMAHPAPMPPQAPVGYPQSQAPGGYPQSQAPGGYPPTQAPVYATPAPPVHVPHVVHAGPSHRDMSPSRTTTTSSYEYYDDHHHHHHHHGPEFEQEVSHAVPVGPLALAERRRSRSRSRAGKDIRAEIKALEKELATRPKGRGDRELIRTERLPNGELVVYEEQTEQISVGPKPPRIEKNRKGQMSISLPKHR